MIVDASVVVKWLNQSEQDADKALFLYKNHIEEKEQISIPQFLYVEIANYLATKTNSSEDSIKEGLQFLYDSHLTVYGTTQTALLETAVMARKYKTSVYDMLYAVLAKANNTLLITADKRFAKSVNFPFVKLLTE